MRASSSFKNENTSISIFWCLWIHSDQITAYKKNVFERAYIMHNEYQSSHSIENYYTTHWVNSRISRNSRINRPKIGLFGPLYGIQTMIKTWAKLQTPLSYLCHQFVIFRGIEILKYLSDMRWYKLFKNEFILKELPTIFWSDMKLITKTQ